MGLDLTAYSNVKLLPKDHGQDRESDEYWDTTIRACTYEGFQRSTRGLADHDVVTKDERGTLWIADREYDISKSLRHAWRGGSYSGYGRRREVLRTYAGIPETPSIVTNEWITRHQDMPFFELVWFADNEGCIGSEAAADLLADFEELIRERGDDDVSKAEAMRAVAVYKLGKEWINDWIKGLTLAADNGLVWFR